MVKNMSGFGQRRSNDSMKMIFIVGGLFLLLTASIGTILAFRPKQVVKEEVSTLNPSAELIDVLVPSKQIDSGMQLDPTFFHIEKKDKNTLPPRVLSRFDQIQGYYARTIIVPNQPVSAELITKVRPVNDVTKNIPEGYRAVSIKVDETSGVEGWARPGAKVDVVWTGILNGEQSVNTLVTNAKILSAGKQTEESNLQPQNAQQASQAGVPQTVTLLVTVEDSNKIQLATQYGVLRLSLRGDSETMANSESETMTLNKIFKKDLPQEDQYEKNEGIVRIKRPDGGVDEFVMKKGKLVPVK